MLIGGLAGLWLPHTLAEGLLLPWCPNDAGSISPGGSYAFLSYQRFSPWGMDISSFGSPPPADYRLDFIRVADNAVLHHLSKKTPGYFDGFFAPFAWGWVTDTVAVRSRCGDNISSHKTLLYHLDTGKIIPMPADYAVGTPSPNGYLTVSESPRYDGKHWIIRMTFCNLDNGHTAKLDVIIPVGNVKGIGSFCRWESNDTVLISWSSSSPVIRSEKRLRVPRL